MLDAECAPSGGLVARVAARLRGGTQVAAELVDFSAFSAADPEANVEEELTNTLCLHGERRSTAAAMARRFTQGAMAPSPRVVEVEVRREPKVYRNDEEYMHELLAIC